jgi:hypothetical protein
MKKAVLLIVTILLGAVLAYGQFDFGFGFDDFDIGGNLPVSPALQKGRDKADDAMDKAAGRIPMRFYNAINRNPIAGALVEISNIGSYTTNNVGKIAFPRIPDGNYTLIFSREGFVTTPIEFRVLLGAVDLNWYSISPGIPDKDYRIILEWAETPADLDLHFVKTGGSGGYHISYFNMRRAEDGNAVLDRDDTSGYGPETITIGTIDTNATYTCYVHDYTNRNNGNSTQMAREGAIIRIYSQNRLMHTIRIPANGVGTIWNVFKIERGRVVIENTVVAR